jgi:hypothetical protein
MNPFALLFTILGTVLTLAGALLLVRRRRFKQEIARIRQALETVSAAPEQFSPDMLADQPEPVQRYFRHAIEPGTPLASQARLEMFGTIKLGNDWHPFTARQILVPFQGFIWQAHASVGGLSMQGADYYHAGEGRMRFDGFGLIPMVNSTGPDVAKSALGRLVGETILMPAGLLPQRGVIWEAQSPEHIAATVTGDGEPITINVTIDARGSVRELVLQRWNSDERAYAPFGMLVEEEHTFAGYTIPSRIRAGWWYGSDRFEAEGEFFRATIKQVNLT